MAGCAKRLIVALIVAGSLIGCSQERYYGPIETYRRGLDEYHMGNYTEAAGYFKWSTQLRRDYSAPMIGLTQCHLHFASENLAKGNPGAAMQNLEEALYWNKMATNCDPGNPKVTQMRVEILKRQGLIEEIEKAAKWGVTVQGPNAASLLLMAQTYIDLGDYDQAEVSYSQAIAVDPYNPRVRIQTAQFYEKIGQYDKALRLYEQAYRLDPTNPTAQIKITQLSGSYDSQDY